MDQAPRPADQKNETTQAKKEYHPPQVREYGTVADLTQTGSSPAPGPDNGTELPNIYVTGRI